MLGQSSHSQVPSTKSWILGSLFSLALLSACTHQYIPADTNEISGDPDANTEVTYDYQQFDNTQNYPIPDNGIMAPIPRVQATLSQQSTGLYKGSKTQSADVPPYVIIEYGDVDRWRYATVATPPGGRTIYAEYDRLPISKPVPPGSYIIIRPMRRIFGTNPDPSNKNAEAYLFKVLGNATAETSPGNLLSLKSTISAIKNTDWVVPIDMLDFSQEGISSIIGKSGRPEIIAIAPDSFYGMSGQYAVVQGGTNVGLNVGENMIVQGSRVAQVGGTRAVRDGREIKPEGNALVAIVQATNAYSLAEILQASQPVGEGDILMPTNQ